MKQVRVLSVLVKILVIILTLFNAHQLSGQDYRWRVSAGGVCSVGGRHIGLYQHSALEFLPCASGEFAIARLIYTKGNYVAQLEYRRGSFATRLKANFTKEDYPYVRTEIFTSFYFVQHPYHVLGINHRIYSNGKCDVVLFSGLRFVPRSRSSVGSQGYDVNNNPLKLFQAQQRIEGLNISADCRLTGTFRISERWSCGLSMVGISSQPIRGSYVFYPNKGGYTLQGQYRLAQLFAILDLSYSFGSETQH